MNCSPASRGWRPEMEFLGELREASEPSVPSVGRVQLFVVSQNCPGNTAVLRPSGVLRAEVGESAQMRIDSPPEIAQ